jgi:hypothetical protein
MQQSTASVASTPISLMSVLFPLPRRKYTPSKYMGRPLMSESMWLTMLFAWQAAQKKGVGADTTVDVVVVTVVVATAVPVACCVKVTSGSVTKYSRLCVTRTGQKTASVYHVLSMGMRFPVSGSATHPICLVMGSSRLKRSNGVDWPWSWPRAMRGRVVADATARAPWSGSQPGDYVEAKS